MNKWMWVVAAQSVVIIGLVLSVIFRHDDHRFTSLGNHDGDG